MGWALQFCDISLRYAPTPQAKGKIEREHQFGQGRLPAYFASEEISNLDEANRHIDALRHHRNAQELHRELRETPLRAWNHRKKSIRAPPGTTLSRMGLHLERSYAAQSRQR